MGGPVTLSLILGPQPICESVTHYSSETELVVEGGEGVEFLTDSWH